MRKIFFYLRRNALFFTVCLLVAVDVVVSFFPMHVLHKTTSIKNVNSAISDKMYCQKLKKTRKN